jgi:hypothetical protein
MVPLRRTHAIRPWISCQWEFTSSLKEQPCGGERCSHFGDHTESLGNTEHSPWPLDLPLSDNRSSDTIRADHAKRPDCPGFLASIQGAKSKASSPEGSRVFFAQSKVRVGTRQSYPRRWRRRVPSGGFCRTTLSV